MDDDRACRRCGSTTWKVRQTVGDRQADCYCNECLTDEERQFMKEACAEMEKHCTFEGRA